jgi:hypothetical protein
MPIYAEVRGFAWQPLCGDAPQPVGVSVARRLVADNECLSNTAEPTFFSCALREKFLAEKAEAEPKPKLPSRQNRGDAMEVVRGWEWDKLPRGNLSHAD